MLKYTYDDNGNVLTVQSVKNDGFYNTGYGGISLVYSWDRFNRLLTVTDNGAGGGVTTYNYDGVDHLSECVYPAATGLKHSYSYNGADWLNQVDVKYNTTVRGSFAYDFARAVGGTYYGRAGTRMGATESLSGSRSVQYDYDPLYRLTKENVVTGNPSGIVTYDATSGYGDMTGFDKVGNRRLRSSSLSGVPAASYSYYSNDKLQTEGYDANGNTTVSGTYTLGYDFENHLITHNGTPALSFVYDHNGNRVKKTGSTATFYLVDDQSPSGYPQVVEELSAVGANPVVTKTYTHGLRLISQRFSGTVQYYGHDGHGNVRLLLSSDGTVAQTYNYDAFGLSIPSTPAAGNDYLYAGEQYDRDLGMYYLRARYYNPQTGRFWTMDTYQGDQENPPSLHKYLYCAGNPVNSTDPSGNKLVFRGGSDDEADYEEALTYLKKSRKAKEIIDYLIDTTAIIYTIQAEFPTMFDKTHWALNQEYDPKLRTIFWIPTGAIEWQDKKRAKLEHISPALILIHELGHAYHHDRAADPGKWIEQTKDKSDKVWSNAEGKRTIEEIENVVARELGGVESMRSWHNPSVPFKHRQYITTSPIGIEAAVNVRILNP